MQGGVDNAKQSPKGVAEQRYVGYPSALLHHAHDLSEIMIHIGLKSAPAVFLERWNPISEIDRKPLTCKILHDTAAWVQVEDEGAF